MYKFYKHQDGLFGLGESKYVMVNNTKTNKWFAVYLGHSLKDADCAKNHHKNNKYLKVSYYLEHVKDGICVEIEKPQEILT